MSVSKDRVVVVEVSRASARGFRLFSAASCVGEACGGTVRVLLHEHILDLAGAVIELRVQVGEAENQTGSKVVVLHAQAPITQRSLQRLQGKTD